MAAFVARWDLDKTYLRTEFDTLGDLLRTAIERPDRKRSVPGASAVLRELGDAGARVHILSGSPRQMRGVLEEKLRIDHVRWDELTLKPNLGNLLSLRFRAMRDQLGYKLPALLGARLRDQQRDGGALLSEMLVGDDAEADAFVYSLYADVCAGSVDAPTLQKVLRAGKLYDDQTEAALAATSALEKYDAVQRILIHLDRQSPPSRFDDYGARVVPFYNYLQAAFVLGEDGRLGAAAVLRVAVEFAERHGFDADALARSYLDLMRRGHVTGALPAALEAERAAHPDATGKSHGSIAEMSRLLAGYVAEPPDVTRRPAQGLDYLDLAKKHQGGKNRHAASR